ncbi:MAG: hypothetical protein O7H39_17135 [Gammaproteobacteria bacterium]|nr:hypothetical protein [Gammaproteobacteria bacterium]
MAAYLLYGLSVLADGSGMVPATSEHGRSSTVVHRADHVFDSSDGARDDARDRARDKVGLLRPLQDIHDELVGKFTPISQRPEDEVLINHFGDKPFTGDCDDYYMAAYNQLQIWGYVPHAKFVRTKTTGKRHIIACTEVNGNTRCLDPNNASVRTLGELKKQYRILETRRVLAKSR